MIKLTIANVLTASRILLSPVFFFVFLAINDNTIQGTVPLVVLLVLFFILEMSDLLDGLVARKLNQVSDFGKVFDPLADSLCRLTYFLSFTVAGIMEPWILLVLVYRDILVAYVRLVLMQNNIVLGAKWSGKVKAWVYALGGVFGIIYFLLKKYLPQASEWYMLHQLSDVIFMGCALMALITIVDYLSSLRGLKKK